jgi:hypothetical protein
MMPLTNPPHGQKEWTTDWIPDTPPMWGGGNRQFPAAHKHFIPIGVYPQQEGDQDQRHQHTIITPQKETPQSTIMIQLFLPMKWTTDIWKLITNDPTKINMRQFQNKGTNKGSSHSLLD